MRIITLNCNGLRSAASKGVFDWLTESDADVICLQETRAHADQRGKHGGFGMAGMDAYFEDSDRPGYSGVALYCRRRPDRLLRGIGVLKLTGQDGAIGEVVILGFGREAAAG
jgi:exodeoxyribonuclease-3